MHPNTGPLMSGCDRLPSEVLVVSTLGSKYMYSCPLLDPSAGELCRDLQSHVLAGQATSCGC